MSPLDRVILLTTADTYNPKTFMVEFKAEPESDKSVYV